MNFLKKSIFLNTDDMDEDIQRFWPSERARGEREGELARERQRERARARESEIKRERETRISSADIGDEDIQRYREQRSITSKHPVFTSPGGVVPRHPGIVNEREKGKQKQQNILKKTKKIFTNIDIDFYEYIIILK